MGQWRDKGLPGCPRWIPCNRGRRSRNPAKQSGTTPETDAMYQQGMEDNPWLNQEGDSQAATDAWWDNQEYGQKVGGASGSPFLITIGGALSGGRDILKKGADWWWGDEMRGR